MTNSESPRSSYESPEDIYPVMQVMIWLLVLVLTVGLALYFLWPSSTLYPEKGDQYTGKTTDRQIPIRSTVSQAEVEPPLPEAIVEAGIQDVEEKETGVAAKTAGLEHASASEIMETPPAMMAEAPPGPHASIEREGNMVTIILSEGEIQDNGPLTLASDPAGQDIEMDTPGVGPLEAEDTEVLSTEVESLPDQDLEPEEGNEEPAILDLVSGPPEETMEIEIVSRKADLPATSQTSREIIHVVVRGDTLWHIARRYIHDPFRYPELARLSNIKNPDLIYPGDKVRILIIRH